MRPRRHGRRDAVVDHLVHNQPVSYSSENYVVLAGLAHFHSAQLTLEQQKRAVALLDEWQQRRAAQSA
jgi:hypothetical protein